MSTFDKVREIIFQQTCIPKSEIVDESDILDDLGLDSLDQVELVMAFETDFNIDIPDDEAGKIKTVGDAVRLVDSKLAERPGCEAQ